MPGPARKPLADRFCRRWTSLEMHYQLMADLGPDAPISKLHGRDERGRFRPKEAS